MTLPRSSEFRGSQDTNLTLIQEMIEPAHWGRAKELQQVVQRNLSRSDDGEIRREIAKACKLALEQGIATEGTVDFIGRTFKLPGVQAVAEASRRQQKEIIDLAYVNAGMHRVFVDAWQEFVEEDQVLEASAA